MPTGRNVQSGPCSAVPHGSPTAGATALDAYRDRLRETPTCPECGYVDDGADWRTAYHERRLVYRHDCPRCAAVDTRVIRFDGAR
ncbi:HVO_0649 family zinc finger protein [Halobaculum rubrum]|uniref:HVO_0649 family zinc finger protein n=1 Tax=Halobaculum rubrum TaxID=2872158 RepID=UPI0031F2FBED